MAGAISEAFQGLQLSEIQKIIAQRVDQGEDPYALLVECQEEMVKIGKRFECGEYFLSELILTATMFQRATDLLAPQLRGTERGPKETLGRIVLGTPQGDIHDLGKNIFRFLATAQGFEVVDLGVNVPSRVFVDRAQQAKAEIVGMSGLITTVYPVMKEVVDLLRAEGLRDDVKVIIGGGAAGEPARRLVGADAWTLDAGEGVQICRGFVGAAAGRAAP